MMTNHLRDGLAKMIGGYHATGATDEEIADACLEYLAAYFEREEVIERAADAIGTLVLKRKLGLPGYSGAKMLAAAALREAIAPDMPALDPSMPRSLESKP